MVKGVFCDAAAPLSGDRAVEESAAAVPPAARFRSPRLVETRNITFRADDGFALAGTLFTSNSGNGPAVLINSATAVARGYYAKFAVACVMAGARAALVYDYRGTGGSQAPADWQARINMKDWGILDMPAAIGVLQTEAPGAPLCGVGHSIGGTNLGLCGIPERFERFAMVASSLGTLALTDEKIGLFVRMNFIGRPITAILGKAPGWMGIGETLPASVFCDWARWCRQRNYLFDDPDIPEAERFEKVNTEILSVSVADDPWATDRGVVALESRFSNARIRRWRISPATGGGPRIGHFGFFRSRYARDLWPGMTGWLLAG